MKKIILQLILLILITSSCSDSNVGSSVNPCGSVSDFTVTESNDIVDFSLVSSATDADYEIMVASPTFEQIGGLHAMNQPTEQFTLAELGMETGNTYLLYARSVCGNNAFSDWSNVKTLVVD